MVSLPCSANLPHGQTSKVAKVEFAWANGNHLPLRGTGTAFLLRSQGWWTGWPVGVSCDRRDSPILMGQSLNLPKSLNFDLFTAELTMWAPVKPHFFECKLTSRLIRSFTRNHDFEWYIISVPQNLSIRGGETWFPDKIFPTKQIHWLPV